MNIDTTYYFSAHCHSLNRFFPGFKVGHSLMLKSFLPWQKRSQKKVLIPF